MSTVPDVKVETSEAICTAIITNTTDNTTTTTTTDTTTTTATTTTTTTTTTITTATTTATSNMIEEKKDIVENPIVPCIKLEDSKNGQLHSDIAANVAAEKSLSSSSAAAVTEEKAGLVQSSDGNAVAKDGTNANIVDRPEVVSALIVETVDITDDVTANEVTSLQKSANNFDQNKTDLNTSDEHNLNIISVQTSKPETATPTSPEPSESEINTIAATVEPPDVALIPSGGEKEKNDLKDGGDREINKDAEKDNNDSERDYKTKEKSTFLDDKEVSSDETDHFVDAKSSTMIDGASENNTVEISEETKEQAEEIQDEEGYEYDEEEQEAEPDDDEVEGNPAFIPKSGRYYMHDSRNTDEERTPEPSSHSRADGKWKHDRFDERSQRPKTKRELMNRYGYDIRNEGKNTGGGSMNVSTPHSVQTRGTSRGGSSGGNNFGNRGRHSNRALPHHPQHQPDDRRDHRRPVQSSGAGRPANRGGRKGEHHLSVNHQRDQHGTRVFKNSPMNTQKGAINRTDNHRSYDRSEEYLRDNRQNGGGNRGRGSTGVSGGDASSTVHGKGSGAHTGGKRYSTQRLATNYAPNVQQPPPPHPPPPPLQPTPTTGPIPIPPPDWRPPAYQGPPPPSTVPPPQPPPPPIAIPAPVPNFRPNDIVYFDPQPQQLYRNPIPPRTRKRLEIVPPYQAKNSN